jgi:hypothetical protein
MFVVAKDKQLWDGISCLGNLSFPYETDLTLVSEIVMMISHDDCMCVIQMRCWLLKMEARK